MRLSKEKLDRLNAFDEAAEKAGGYVAKRSVNAPAYNIQQMHKWCIAHNREVETLTPAEREMFRVAPVGQRDRYAVP